LGNHPQKAYRGFEGAFITTIKFHTKTELKALEINKNGSPHHPLYLKKDLIPKTLIMKKLGRV